MMSSLEHFNDTMRLKKKKKNREREREKVQHKNNKSIEERKRSEAEGWRTLTCQIVQKKKIVFVVLITGNI
jgi:hypothetical protein